MKNAVITVPAYFNDSQRQVRLVFQVEMKNKDLNTPYVFFLNVCNLSEIEVMLMFAS